MNQHRLTRMLRFGLTAGLQQGLHLLLFPDIILIAEEQIIPLRLAEQGQKIRGCTKVFSLLSAGAKSPVPLPVFGKNFRRSVFGAVILPEYSKIGKCLGGKGFKLRPKKSFSLVHGQKNADGHQVIPHFRKYLQTERI